MLKKSKVTHHAAQRAARTDANDSMNDFSDDTNRDKKLMPQNFKTLARFTVSIFKKVFTFLAIINFDIKNYMPYYLGSADLIKKSRNVISWHPCQAVHRRGRALQAQNKKETKN